MTQQCSTIVKTLQKTYVPFKTLQHFLKVILHSLTRQHKAVLITFSVLTFDSYVIVTKVLCASEDLRAA